MDLFRFFIENRNEVMHLAFEHLLMVLVATILVDSFRIWMGILQGTREARVCEAPFVMSHLRAEEL